MTTGNTQNIAILEESIKFIQDNTDISFQVLRLLTKTANYIYYLTEVPVINSINYIELIMTDVLFALETENGSDINDAITFLIQQIFAFLVCAMM